MENKPDKSPYHGIIPTIIVLCLPSIILTWLFNYVLLQFQTNYSDELNVATARFLGCGLGTLYHLSCWIAGVFKEPTEIVRNRLREFFSDLKLSPKLAFRWYWEDIRFNGVAYWIYFTIIITNFIISINGLINYLALV